MSAAALAGARPRGLSLARADRALSVLLAGALVALAVGVVLRLGGLTVLVEQSDSMRPAIPAGDVLIDRGVASPTCAPARSPRSPTPATTGG